MDLDEWIEDGFLLLARNADSGIRDSQQSEARGRSGARAKVDGHRAAARRELHGVREEVDENLLKFVTIGANQHVRRDARDVAEALGGGLGLDHRRDR